MGRGFKFKLEGPLKLRKFNEEKRKIELGEINQEIHIVKEKIEELKNHIEEAYNSRENSLQAASSGFFVKFFPYYVETKYQEIKNQKMRLEALEKKYQKKMKEVEMAINSTKVVENLKEKKLLEYKKNLEKKDQDEIEESSMMRFHLFQKKGVIRGKGERG